MAFLFCCVAIRPEHWVNKLPTITIHLNSLFNVASRIVGNYRHKDLLVAFLKHPSFFKYQQERAVYSLKQKQLSDHLNSGRILNLTLAPPGHETQRLGFCWMSTSVHFLIMLLLSDALSWSASSTFFTNLSIAKSDFYFLIFMCMMLNFTDSQ